MKPSFLCLLAFCLGSWGCSLPPIQIESQEPIQVDIRMRVDVYQHRADSSPSPTPAAGKKKQDNPFADRRERMSQIQSLKNNRIIGENHNGLLSIRDLPPGAYGDYVKMLVEAENQDRMELMKETAQQRGVSLREIQNEQAELWRQRSFAGEWIEEKTPEGKWRWMRKDDGGEKEKKTNQEADSPSSASRSNRTGFRWVSITSPTWAPGHQRPQSFRWGSLFGSASRISESM